MALAINGNQLFEKEASIGDLYDPVHAEINFTESEMYKPKVIFATMDKDLRTEFHVGL